MAMTDPRQFWRPGRLQMGFRCSSPVEVGEIHESPGCVGAAPVLASLTRLLSCTQLSAPCLALNDFRVMALAWHWPTFSMFSRATFPHSQSRRWGAKASLWLGFHISGPYNKEISPWNDHPLHTHSSLAGEGLRRMMPLVGWALPL